MSHHGLGDIAVVIFFGFVPVVFTEYVQTGILRFNPVTFFTSLAVGLMAANVLIVNNYRDCEDDKAAVYLLNGLIAAASLACGVSWAPSWTCAGVIAYVCVHIRLWSMLRKRNGAQLNDVLKFTAITLLCVSIYLLVVLAVWHAGVWEQAA